MTSLSRIPCPVVHNDLFTKVGHLYKNSTVYNTDTKQSTLYFFEIVTDSTVILCIVYVCIVGDHAVFTILKEIMAFSDIDPYFSFALIFPNTF